MARRGGLLLWCMGLAFPEGSSRRGLDALARSSRQAPLAGALPPWPGKLLLPGVLIFCLAYFVLECLVFAGPQKEQWRPLALPWQALSHGATTARAQVRGTKVPLLYYTDRSRYKLLSNIKCY